MWTIVLIGLLFWAITKWFMWRLSFMAVLLYYADCGMELPDAKIIQKYQVKVVEKYIGIKK